jgi:hypothetical protein
MRRCLPCLLLLLLFFPGPAQSKKKDPDIPALFRQARYVYVEAVDGDEFNPRLYPEDRQAIADVRHALQAWNRYTLTIRQQDADLVFVVRKGRLADARVFVGDRIGSRTSVSQTPDQDPNRDPARYPNAGADVGESGRDVGESGRVGSPDDLIFVDAVNPEGRRGARIWTQTRTDGLNTPEMPLFKQLRDAVDKAYPR